MTIVIRTDNIDDLLPSEYKEVWPPLSDEEIEERQRQAEWDDYYNSILMPVRGIPASPDLFFCFQFKPPSGGAE